VIDTKYNDRMTSPVDVLGVVINDLHVSGKLSDKVVIEQELKNWLPAVSDYDLKCSVVCTWLTARCFMQPHEIECSRSEVEAPEDIIAHVDSIQIKKEVDGNEPFSVLPVAALTELDLDCKPTLKLKHSYVLLGKIPQLTGEWSHRHFGDVLCK
jgi:hypothetical protein